ncbi:uncharacterized protein IUM83_07427 [Phytophthora cinnamomi]|uniref:uncharacterized protein n=1 Tax=Phytophthora cinnamomi TaxID=4785 RepID=UPI00355AA7C7|nr:hypothetical protein IUM83_07427 [Phytophthora cinnamomi]
MESDAENDDGGSDDDESSMNESNSEGDGDDDNEAEENLIESMFGQSLLDAVGGIASVASGTITPEILKDMTTNVWSKPVSYKPFPFLHQPYEPRSVMDMREDYPRRYEGYYGPTAHSYLDWHVAKDDVYGEQFCTSWEAADEDHEDMDDFNLDELHDALDDAALIDE